MTIAAQTPPASTGATTGQGAGSGVPAGWRELRDNSDIQFEPVTAVPPPPPEPREPSWFEQGLVSFFQWLGDLLAPLGQLLGISWPVLQWILIALLVALIAWFVVRSVGPLAGRNRKLAKDRRASSEPEWQPTEEQSVALLEDADRLAAEGRYDEATHLLLQRSVIQIADARPDWVEPSSTARELAALPALSSAARGAFATISDRVERSLFALRSLNREDWEAARKAYSDFALARIEAPEPGAEAERVGGFGRKAIA